MFLIVCLPKATMPITTCTKHRITQINTSLYCFKEELIASTPIYFGKVEWVRASPRELQTLVITNGMWKFANKIMRYLQFEMGRIGTIAIATNRNVY